MKYLRPAVPTLAEPSSTGGRRNDHPVLQPPLIQVSDQLERRIRKPADALRCVVACIVIVAAVVTAIAASATTAGAETDIVGASRRLPDALSNDIPQIARFGLLILPLALAVCPARSAPGPPSHRGVRDRRAGRRRGRGRQHPARAPRRRPALLRDHHGARRHQPRRCPRPLPGRPGRLRHDDRADRAAWLAERADPGDRRVRCRPARGVDLDARKRADDPDHAAGRLRHRHGRPVRCRARRRSVRRPGRSARRCPPGASGGPGTTGT